MIESVSYAPRTFVGPTTSIIHQRALTLDAAYGLAIIRHVILQLSRNTSDDLKGFIRLFEAPDTSLCSGLLQEEIDVVNAQRGQSLVWSFKIQQEPSE